MPTLADIRKAHPEYADLSDQQMADGLYKKFYADMPRAQFNAKLGLAPARAAPAAPVAQWVNDHVANDPGLIGGAYRAMRKSVDQGVVTHAQRQAAGAPSFGSLLNVPGEVAGAVSGAWGQLKTDARSDRAAFSGQMAHPSAGGLLQDYGRKAKIAADVAGLITSPLTGATHAVVVKPVAKALSLVPGVSYGDAEEAVSGALSGLPPERGLIGRTAARTVVPRAGPRALAAQTSRATPLTDSIAQFDQAGVRPSLVASRASDTAPITKAISENAIAGARVRRHIAGQIDDVSSAASRAAQSYGTPLTRQAVGQSVREGVNTFANAPEAGTFKTRAGELYDKAFGDLDQALVGKQDPVRTVPDRGTYYTDRVKQVGGSQVAAPAAKAALDGMVGGVQSKPIADLIADPTLKRVATALNAGERDMTFGDLRSLRTWVRTAQSNNDLRQTIGSANLQRLEGALTQDIYSNAEKLGSPQMLHQLKRADDYYSAGMSRINDRLNAVFKAKSDESAYDMLHRAAQDAGGADIAKLTALKRSLGPDWGDIAATMVDRLGKARPGAVMGEEDPFSIANFVTNYAKLSDAGKETVFGSRAGGGAQATRLKRELDNLALVAGKMKGVEAAANHSKSGVSVQNLASAGGLLNPHTTIPTALGLGGWALTGEVMTNPAAVRLIAKMAEARGAAQSAEVERGIKALGVRSPEHAAQLERYWRALANSSGYSTPQQTTAR
jgi:hypothetical protein